VAPIEDLLDRMESLLAPLRERSDERRHFLATYLRTTRAVKDEIATASEWSSRAPERPAANPRKTARLSR
jgi:hypothetical protein